MAFSRAAAIGKMKQGEIWFVDLNPTKGSEQAGQRPVVVISGNLLNEHLTVVIVVPLTTKIKNYNSKKIKRCQILHKIIRTKRIFRS